MYDCYCDNCAVVKPRFDANHSRESFAWAGRARNVTCRVDAHPPPVIHWQHNGQVIESNDTFRIYQTDMMFKSIGFLQVGLLLVIDNCFNKLATAS